MASPVFTQHIFSRTKLALLDHDPGGTSAILASPDGGTTPHVWDMSEFTHFGVQASPSIIGGNGITKLEIVASILADMSNPVVVKEVDSLVLDAPADYASLECIDAEVRNLGVGLRYVCARLTMASATDEAKVLYIGMPRNPRENLTVAVNQT